MSDQTPTGSTDEIDYIAVEQSARLAYVSFANRKIDPLATEIREELEKAQGQA